MQLIINRVSRRICVDEVLFTNVTLRALDVLLFFQLNKHEVLINDFWDEFRHFRRIHFRNDHTRGTKNKKKTIATIIYEINREISDYDLRIESDYVYYTLIKVTEEKLFIPNKLRVIYKNDGITVKQYGNTDAIKIEGKDIAETRSIDKILYNVGYWKNMFFYDEDGKKHAFYDKNILRSYGKKSQNRSPLSSKLKKAGRIIWNT